MTVGRIVLTLCATGTLLTIAPGTVAAGDRQQPSAADRIVRDTKDAAEATKAYTIQQKEAFQKAIQKELNEMQVKIADLQKKTSAASVEARADLRKAIQELEKKKDLARKKLEEVNESTTAAWSTLKEGITTAVTDLRKSYTEAISKLP
ncbi:MAG: hypothetical protein H0V35_06905 [Nitrospira sp.]|nr:hypothetical protein [Nitrospira sp.]